MSYICLVSVYISSQIVPGSEISLYTDIGIQADLNRRPCKGLCKNMLSLSFTFVSVTVYK